MTSRQTTLLTAVTFVLGLVHTYLYRHVIHSDGIAYLDIASAYLRGHWANAINAYWSPLYSWILAAVLWCFRPTYWEVGALHAVNFAAFCLAALAFSGLSRQAALYFKIDPQDSLWIAGNYALFLWASLGMVTLSEPSPDLVGMAAMFLVFGLLLRTKNDGISSGTMVVTGISLGLAYLARAAYFPLAVMCLGGMVALFRDRRVALAGAAFALMVGPFVVSISIAKGHFTFGEAGKLNYAWQVNSAARSYHWQGEGQRTGKPLHPTRKIVDSPSVFEFATPVAGTYPPWYDPSYWYAGVNPQFSFERQWPVFFKYAKYWLVLLLVTPGAIVTIPWNLRSRNAALKAFRGIGWLVALPLSACGMFCLVVVDKRHVAAFLAVIGLALWGAAYGELRYRTWAVVYACASASALVAVPTAVGVYTVLVDAARGAEGSGNPAWAISQGMTKAGLREGDRIGYIGCSINAYWARLSGVRIVADVNYIYDVNDDLPVTLHENTRELEKFWAADGRSQRRVLDGFAKAGASFAVADHIPANANLDGWMRIDGQTYARRVRLASLDLPGML